MLLDAQQTANRLLRFPVATTGLRGMTFMASLFLSRDFTAHKGALCNAFFAGWSYTASFYGAA